MLLCLGIQLSRKFEQCVLLVSDFIMASLTGKTVKRQRKVLTMQKKLDLINEYTKKNVSVKIRSQKYGVGTQTVYDLIKNKDKILKFCAESDSVTGFQNRKTLKSAEDKKVDFATYEWFRQERFKGTPISSLMITEQAKFFHSALNATSECVYSHGWLQNFKKRHGIHKLKSGGEKASADYVGATMFVDELEEFISRENLTNEQIYNGDETSLFWKCFPESSLVCHDEHFIDGHKNSKERITVLLCANAAGTHKCKPLVIGKSARPRALKNVHELPVTYTANTKAWVTQKIFLEWFNNNFVPEVRQHFLEIGLNNDSKVLLLLDNCPAHPEVQSFNAQKVFVKYMPPNCTSLIQPMDQGVIWSFKSHYRKTQMQKLLTSNNIQMFKKSFNIKNALWSISNAWDAVTSSVLKNVWNNLLCPQIEGMYVYVHIFQMKKKHTFHK